MSEHTLLRKQVRFTDAEDRAALYIYRTVEAMKAAETDFLAWYANCQNISTVLDKYLVEVKSLVAIHASDVLFEELAMHKIYDIGKEAYDKECLMVGDALSAYNKVVDAYNEIVYQLEEEKAYREERKAERGKFVGGGFGLGGAVKGMATAGALNMATGATHSFANAIGNAASESDASEKKRALYRDAKEVLCEAVTDCVNRAFSAHIAIINARIPNYICAKYDQTKSNAFLENAKKVTEDRAALLVSAFEQCPWNYGVYSYIFNTFPTERRNILDIAVQYHVDLSEDVESILSREYTDTARENEAAAQEAKTRIIAIMQELGISESKTFDALEQDCIERICKSLSTATEADCEGIRAKVLAYDALQKNKEPFLAKIKERIEVIWSAEDAETFAALLLKIDMLDDDEVKKGFQYIDEIGRTENKHIYLDVFKNINRKNIAKARRFAPIAGTGATKVILRNLGYILMVIGAVMVIVSGYESDFALVPFWGGVLIAIILGVQKSAWNKLTLKGKVVNPILTLSKKDYEKAVAVVVQKQVNSKNSG